MIDAGLILCQSPSGSPRSPRTHKVFPSLDKVNWIGLRVIPWFIGRFYNFCRLYGTTIRTVLAQWHLYPDPTDPGKISMTLSAKVLRTLLIYSLATIIFPSSFPANHRSLDSRRMEVVALWVRHSGTTSRAISRSATLLLMHSGA